MCKCITVPTRGYKKPAPTLALTSRIGRVNPVGAPFREGSCDNDKCVFAIQIGKLLKPCIKIYRSLTWSIFMTHDLFTHLMFVTLNLNLGCRCYFDFFGTIDFLSNYFYFLFNRSFQVIQIPNCKSTSTILDCLFS